MKETANKARKGKEAKEAARIADEQPVFKGKAIGGSSTTARIIFRGRKKDSVKLMCFLLLGFRV